MMLALALLAVDPALIAHAARLTEYAVPAVPPSVETVTGEWMGQRACPKNPNKCPVLGLYDDKDVIYIRDGLAASVHEHVLLHELVHWLQHHSGKFNLDRCIDTALREREAFQAQNAYIITVQNGALFSPLPPINCPAE